MVHPRAAITQRLTKRRHQPAAKNHSAIFQLPAPKVGKIHGIERLARISPLLVLIRRPPFPGPPFPLALCPPHALAPNHSSQSATALKDELSFPPWISHPWPLPTHRANPGRLAPPAHAKSFRSRVAHFLVHADHPPRFVLAPSRPSAR